jgi:signal transduction histidine kinase/DNA-binding response OmpR family regulator
MADDKVDILIVDDLPEKVMVYRAILDELGEDLVVAQSGPEALAQVLKREFAVILMDVYMPGMDGLETAALIRQRKKSAHTPIIFVTAFADEVRVAQGYAQGAVDYILAPVIPEVLRAKVKVFVDLFRMTRQVRRQAEERVALAEERSRRAAAEEANRRLAFLARAGAVLGQSLDYDRTAADTARLPVPDLADLAAVVLADPAHQETRAVVARRSDSGTVIDPAAELSPELAAVVGRAFADGTLASVPEPGDGSDHSPSVVAIPLCASGRTFAVLALLRTDLARPFSLADLAAADALAWRAASALENARLYREIQHADRQKNEFLSMLAHELRNPLAPIRNAVTILRAAGTDPDALGWAGGVIDRQVRHLVRLVDDLLDISRITRGKIRLRREPVEVSAVVTQAVEASRPEIEARNHRLDVTVPDEPVWINGDPARLAQVLTNLLNNAAKYTEPGGRVSVVVESASPRRRGNELVDTCETVIRIRDTGIGIPGDMLACVFDLFTQVDHSLDRSEGGLGIGLTLVRRLVELHGGTVSAASEGPGRGSEFTVRLPMADRAARAGGTAAPLDPTSAVPTSQALRVLVVDDNVDGADSLARLLKLGGHDVRMAHDGPGALAAADTFRPDAVVLDIGLPGMDGYEVARRLRAQTDIGAALLVAVTGYGRDEDRRRSLDAGFDHHLVKPVDVEALRELFAAALSRNGAGMADESCRTMASFVRSPSA